jgi:hypothetical protein
MNKEQLMTGSTIMAGDGGYQAVPLSELKETQDQIDIRWFQVRGHWLIRKVPNTKDQFYVKCGNPPARVLEIYGITQ